MVVHDFDEIGVSSTADVRWRQRGMETWLRRVLDYQDRGLDVLLAGQSPLGEVLASPSAIHLDGIAACLVDVADDERWRRLESRDPGRWHRDAKRSFIGWARWHRGHAADPHQDDVAYLGDPEGLGAADRRAYVVPGPQSAELGAADAQLTDDRGGAGVGSVATVAGKSYALMINPGRCGRRRPEFVGCRASSAASAKGRPIGVRP